MSQQQKLDLWFRVIPRKSLCASNNPKVKLSPPKFTPPRFFIGEVPVALTVKVARP